MKFCATILIGICTWTLALADEELETRAQSHLSNFLYSTMQVELERSLQASGLPKEDIDRTVGEASRRYSVCVINALVADSSPESGELVKKLGDGESGSKLKETFSDATKIEVAMITSRLEAVIKPCWMVANQELGIITE